MLQFRQGRILYGRTSGVYRTPGISTLAWVIVAPPPAATSPPGPAGVRGLLDTPRGVDGYHHATWSGVSFRIRGPGSPSVESLWMTLFTRTDGPQPAVAALLRLTAEQPFPSASGVQIA